MKKLLFIIAVLFSASMLFAVGTVVPVVTYQTSDMVVVTITVTGDASGGTVPSTALSSSVMTAIKGYFLYAMETDPGSTAPTDNYDIALNDARSLDILGGNGTNRDTSNTELAYPATASSAVDGTLTLVVTNTTVNSAGIVVKLYFSKTPGTGTAASLPIPTGASTEAKQPALGTAGTPSADVLSVQGEALMIPIATNITQVGSATHSATNPLFVRIVSSAAVIPDDSAVDAALNAGENPVYIGLIHETTPTVIENGDKGALHGDVNQSLLTSDVTAQTAIAALSTYIQTGSSTHSFVSTASANLTNVKASAGVLYGLMVTNATAVPQYLRLYNKATAPDPSACSGNSDCPVLYQMIPTKGDTDGSGWTFHPGPYGIAFSTGIGYSISGAACTVMSTCTDETVASAGVTITLVYK